VITFAGRRVHCGYDRRVARASQAAEAIEPPEDATLDAQDRRTRLLEAGEQIFAERRYEDVSAQDIAARAGVAHGLLFHYFGNKRRFYYAVLERVSEQTSQRFAVNTTAHPGRWLRKEVDIFLATVVQDDRTFASLIHGSLGAETEAQNVVNLQRRAAAERLIAKLAPERTSPLLTATVTAWTAACNELAAQWLEGGRKTPKTQLRALLIATLDAMLHALASIDRTSRFDPDRFSNA
jgi:AcrR family transcriptional regulator